MKHIIILALLLCAAGATAQSSINDVLQNIETNNKSLQAGRQLLVAQKLEAHRGNNLPDPSVSYTHQYGNKEGLGIQGELVASQSFDFPSVYVQKNKLTKAKGESFDNQHATLRQEVLLQAKEICLDLIYLNQQKALLETRLDNANKLSQLYAVRLKKGDANILETNKIDLEVINAKNEVRMNASQRQAKLKALAALNGGMEIMFSDTTYDIAPEAKNFDLLQQEAIAANPNLNLLKSEQNVDKRQIDVAKNLNLPGLELGYRLNTAKGGERFNGFLVGMSIPLFANRNNVKQAKAQALYKELQIESTTTSMESELQQLYVQALALKTSADEYDVLLKDQRTLDLLNKAITAGQISMIEYFVDATTYYQTLQNYIQIQNEYQKTLAQLYKYKL